MAVPVIQPVTSVLGYLQHQPFRYLPYATNTPTGWSSGALPPGMSFDSETGELIGPVTTAGVYNVSLVATNGDGDSAEVVIPIGIEPSAVSPDSGMDVDIDVISREVFYNGQPVSETPLIFAKEADDLLLYVRFKKADVVIEPEIGALSFGIKEFDGDRLIKISTGFYKINEGADATFVVHINLSDRAIRSVLSNYEEDSGTTFFALGEFRWAETNPYFGNVGPETLVGSTRNFRVALGRPLQAVPEIVS